MKRADRLRIGAWINSALDEKFPGLKHLRDRPHDTETPDDDGEPGIDLGTNLTLRASGGRFFVFLRESKASEGMSDREAANKAVQLLEEEADKFNEIMITEGEWKEAEERGEVHHGYSTGTPDPEPPAPPG